MRLCGQREEFERQKESLLQLTTDGAASSGDSKPGTGSTIAVTVKDAEGRTHQIYLDKAQIQKSAMAHDDATPIGDAIKDVPLFDAHVHYKQPAWGPYPVESIIELMDSNGVAMALVSSTPDEGTIMLWEFAPNRIVPELRPYHGDAGSSNWTKADGMADYLRGRLENTRIRASVNSTSIISTPATNRCSVRSSPWPRREISRCTSIPAQNRSAGSMASIRRQR